MVFTDSTILQRTTSGKKNVQPVAPNKLNNGISDVG
jgi:hypothetical protein